MLSDSAHSKSSVDVGDAAAAAVAAFSFNTRWKYGVMSTGRRRCSTNSGISFADPSLAHAKG